jgi:hypothetical protein
MKFIFIFSIPFLINSQIYYGTKEYVEYHQGNLPIIISVPHDGKLTPENIPDRTCFNPTTITDYNTYKLAKFIDSSLFELTACHPHIVFCNLKRTKLDCNRSKEEAACGNFDAEIAWEEYHNFIRKADSIANENSRVFYIDIHGHGHELQQIELGYLYSSEELNQNDETLNSSIYITKSSIQNLVAQNELNLSNSELLRGEFALGTLLGNVNYPSVPSKQFPNPGSNPYFTGGYSTQTHTSYQAGISTNGVQMEFNFNIRESDQNMKTFADSFAKVLENYLHLHTNQALNSCSNSNDLNEKELEYKLFYPNPNDGILHFDPALLGDFEVYNFTGKIVFKNSIQNKIDINFLENGSYFIKINSNLGSKLYKFNLNN